MNTLGIVAGQMLLSQTAPHVVLPGAGAVALTGRAPTLGRSFTITPGAGAITISGQTPVAGRSATVNPGAGSITATGRAPTIIAGDAGALDAFTTNLWAAYGITRQISSILYAGAAIRVRKSTGGDTTTQQDIGFVGSALDTSALATFAGSETVVVTKFYDQSGNGRDLVQATGASQPRIVNAGTYDGYLRFDASNDELLTSATSGTPATFSVCTKSTFRGNTPTQVVYACGPGGAAHTLAQVYIPNAANNLEVYIANSSGTASDRSFAVLYPQGAQARGFIHTLGAASAALSNRYYPAGTELGGSAGGTPTGSFTAETWRLGSGGGANYAGIDVYSFAIWEADQSANMLAIATAMA